MFVHMFKNLDDSLKITVATHLFKEWEKEYNQTGIIDRQGLIKELNSVHLCFVIINAIGEYIGSVVINMDTPIQSFNTNYWLSNLFIIPEKRGIGIGKDLMAFSENYLFSKGISILHLWCTDELIEFYKKINWNISNKDSTDKKYILIKMLSPVKSVLSFVPS